jgi:hypothetical protein
LICLTRPVSAVKDTPTFPIVEGNFSPGVFSASIGEFGKGFFFLDLKVFWSWNVLLLGK